LVLVGTPPSTEILRYIADNDMTEKVRIHGNVNEIELARLYREAIAFVLSSDEEGLGIVILEAMASGLPVVSTNCGGPSTAIVEGETGFLTPVGDADAMAEAIKRLLDDPSLCQRMGRAGRRVAEDRFSLAVTGKVYLDHYDRLLSESK
jgi:glycosyltransferase involved in cell wall biosynthesis